MTWVAPSCGFLHRPISHDRPSRCPETRNCPSQCNLIKRHGTLRLSSSQTRVPNNSSTSMHSNVAKVLSATLIFTFLIYITFNYRGHAHVVPFESWTRPSSGIYASSVSQAWQKAIDFRIVGLVFYGRRQYVSILNCYLQVSPSIHFQ